MCILRQEGSIQPWKNPPREWWTKASASLTSDMDVSNHGICVRTRMCFCFRVRCDINCQIHAEVLQSFYFFLLLRSHGPIDVFVGSVQSVHRSPLHLMLPTRPSTLPAAGLDCPRLQTYTMIQAHEMRNISLDKNSSSVFIFRQGQRGKRELLGLLHVVLIKQDATVLLLEAKIMREADQAFCEGHNRSQVSAIPRTHSFYLSTSINILEPLDISSL